MMSTERDRVRALIVGAIDKQPAHAHLAHLGENDLLRLVQHTGVPLNLAGRRKSGARVNGRRTTKAE